MGNYNKEYNQKYVQTSEGRAAKNRAARAYYYRNKEKYAEYHKKQKEADPEAFAERKRQAIRKYSKTPKGFYKVVQDRCKKKGKEFSLPQRDFIDWYTFKEKICYYCGVSEETAGGRLEIERRDNRIGYVLNNMELACRVCNSTKGQYLTENEMKLVAELVIKKRYEHK